ncbi:centromere protein W [Mantella aurantiaca]
MSFVDVGWFKTKCDVIIAPSGRMVRSVPRGTIKTAIRKRLPNLRLETNVELLIYLNCVLFLQRLAAEARIKAIEERCSVIKPAHIRAVGKMVLKKSRG